MVRSQNTESWGIDIFESRTFHLIRQEKTVSTPKDLSLLLTHFLY